MRAHLTQIVAGLLVLLLTGLVEAQEAPKDPPPLGELDVLRLEKLVAEDKAPVYVVHFTQADAADSAQSFTSLNLASREEKNAVAAEIAGKVVAIDVPEGRRVEAGHVLARLDDATEEIYALEFEEPAFITLGLCYEERPRFSGGAYHPVLKRVDEFLKQPLRAAMTVRQKRAKVVLDLDNVVIRQVEALKAKGMTSPYLKSFVVARVNPIRFRPKEAPPLSFDEALGRMTTAAEKFNPDKIRLDDLAKSGGAPDEGE